MRGGGGLGGGRLQSRSKIDSFIIDRTFGESCDVHPDVEATEKAEIVYGRFEIQGPPSPSPTGLDDRVCSQYDVVGMDSKDVYGWTRLKGDTNCYFINSNSDLGKFIQDEDSLSCLGYKMTCKQAMKNPGRGFVEKNVRNEVNKIIFTAKLPHLFAMNFVKFEDFSGIFLFSPHSPEVIQSNCHAQFRTSLLLHVNNFLFHCSIVTYFSDFSCEFKSDSINVMKGNCVEIL